VAQEEMAIIILFLIWQHRGDAIPNTRSFRLLLRPWTVTFPSCPPLICLLNGGIPTTTLHPPT